MERVYAFCEKCGRETEHEVVEFNEPSDCWISITARCSECGKVQEINIYS